MCHYDVHTFTVASHTTIVLSDSCGLVLKATASVSMNYNSSIEVSAERDSNDSCLVLIAVVLVCEDRLISLTLPRRESTCRAPSSHQAEVQWMDPAEGTDQGRGGAMGGVAVVQAAIAKPLQLMIMR